jgi:hypothetical protein
MNIIIYQDQDGVAVIHPAEGTTVEQMVAAVPVGAPYAAMQHEDLPEDRYFREAWTLGETGLVVDIEKAKDIQRDHWRRLRAPKLAALDEAFMRALEEGQSTAEIVAAKNALRDVTETELSGSLEEIKANIPTILI